MSFKSRALTGWGVTLALVHATFGLGSGSTANGAEAQLDELVSANPENWTPNVNDGRVNALVQVGNKIIAVGKFTNVTKSGVTYPRNNIFAFDATTGAVDSDFVPNVGTKEVFDVADAGNGNVYIGGAFASVNGVGKTRRVALIDTATGAPVSGFRSPVPNKAVYDLQLQGGRLYIGGPFTAVNGVPRTLLAALNPTTGADTGTVNLAFSGTWNGGTIGVKHFDVSDDGSTLVAVGNFRQIDGLSRPQIVRVNLGGGAATVSNWSTQRFTYNCASVFDTYLRDVDIAPDGSYFVVASTGAFYGGATSGTLCDSASRFEVSNVANADPTWVDYTGGDTLTQVKVVGDLIYLGGHQRWLNNPYAGDKAGPGAVSRKGLAAIDPRNGLPTTWDPTRARGVGVWDFMTTAAGLWVGHDTNLTGGEQRKRVALFPSAGGTPLPAEVTGSLPGDVVLIAPAGVGDGDQVIDRGFDGDTVGSSSTLANGGQDWSASRGAFLVDGVLFTGWANGTLQARTFSGAGFGAAQQVDLHGLTAFANELPNITGMFYDRVQGRLYYSMAGSSRLYYRYFLPESRVVGAVRFDGPTGGGQVDFANVSALFLDGTTLYAGDGSTGNLRSVGWSAGGLTGSAQLVSGPFEGYDWRARGSVLLAP